MAENDKHTESDEPEGTVWARDDETGKLVPADEVEQDAGGMPAPAEVAAAQEKGVAGN